MTNEYFSVWSVSWSNPYKPRPDGFPETILQVKVPMLKGAGAGACPLDIHDAWEEMRSYGYCVQWHNEAPPARQLPIETKQRIRRRNVWKRMLKKYPMFAADFYAQRIQAQPEHYGAYIPDEFADLLFYRTTLGNLKMLPASRQYS